jgi:hypothetical protein
VACNYKGALLVCIKKNKPKDLPYTPSLNITKETAKSKFEFDSFIKEKEGAIRGTFSEVKFLFEKQVVVNDRHGVEMVYIVRYKDMDLGFISTSLFEGNDIYEITGSASNEKGGFVYWRSLFEDCIHRFDLSHRLVE